MKQKIVIGVLCLAVAILSGVCIHDRINNSTLSVVYEKDDFDELYNTSGPKEIFVDLRDEKDYAKGHLSKFINVPFTGSDKDKDIMLSFFEDNYTKQNKYILMCYSSKRASSAFMFLKDEGYNNLILVNLMGEELINGSDDVSTGKCNCLD